jgi:hypothetical protein
LLEAREIMLYWPAVLHILRSFGAAPWPIEVPCPPETPPPPPPPEPPPSSTETVVAETETIVAEVVKSDETESKDEASDDTEPEHVMPPPRSRKQKTIQEFIIKTYGSKWWMVATSTIMQAADEDKEFKKLARPFPDRSTFNRALGRKEPKEG